MLVGDGEADDTDALQAAIDQFRGGSYYIPTPRGLGYRVTRTLVIEPRSGSNQVYLDLIGSGGLAQILWDGPNDGIVFKTKGWKHSRVQGIKVRTSWHSGVTSWSIEAQPSTSYLSFRDCLVSVGTYGVGWRACAESPGDASSISFHNCAVIGEDQTGVGWQPLGYNTLAWSWIGGGAMHLAKAISARNPGGMGHAQHGGQSMSVVGFSASSNLLDLEFMEPGNYLVQGGRYELGTQLLRVGGSVDQSIAVAVRGIEVATYAGPEVIWLGCAASLSLNGCVFNALGGTAYTAAMITSAAGATTGSVYVADSVIEAPAGVHTLGVGWRATLRDVQRRASNGEHAGWFS